MAIFAPSDLKKWREARGMSAADLAEVVNCDTSTIHRYESGKIKPDPNVMMQICEALGDIDRWGDWMRTEYPISYAKMHPETPKLTMQGTIMAWFAAMHSFEDMQWEVMQDVADGKIDDPELKKKLWETACKMLSQNQRLLNLLDNPES